MSTMANTQSVSFPYQEEDIIASEPQVLEPCPPGRHPALLLDVFHCPDEISNFDGKEKPQKIIGLVYQVFPEDGSRQSDGKPFIVAEKLGFSLFGGTATMKPAKLRLRLERWRGKQFTPEEAQNFNLTKLRCAPAWLSVKQNGNFANVEDVEPYKDEEGNLIKDRPQPVYEGYQRPEWMLKPRKFDANRNNGQTQNTQSNNSQPEVTDDEGDEYYF
jgi:hypothetical protein